MDHDNILDLGVVHGCNAATVPASQCSTRRLGSTRTGTTVDSEIIRTSFPHLPVRISLADTHIMDVRSDARRTKAGPGRTTGGDTLGRERAGEATRPSHISGWIQGQR